MVKIYNNENHNMTIWTEEEDGSYETYLPAGTYSFNIQENDAKKKTIVITDSDIQQNLNYSYPMVKRNKRNIYRVKKGQQFDQDLNMENSMSLQIVAESNEDYSLETVWPEDGSYQCYLPGPGTYKVTYGGTAVDTFTVGNDPVTNYDIVCKLYLVSGTITGLRDAFGSICFYSEEDRYMWAETRTFDASKGEMKFFAYLPAGTYQYVAFFNETQKMGSLTVSGDMPDVTIDMPKQIQVSGVLTDAEGIPCPEEIIYLVSENGSMESILTDQCGRYQFYSYPGTYTINYMVQKDGAYFQCTHDEPLTVGETDMLFNIQKKAAEDIGGGDIVGPVDPPVTQEYKVSGTLYGTAGIWANTEMLINGDYVTTDENGHYECMMQPGAGYLVTIPGIIDTAVAEISVTDSDVEKDIKLDYVRICGRLLHGGEPVGESDLALFKGWYDNMEFVTSIQTGEDGSYTFYISPDTEYTIQFFNTGMELVRGRVQQSDTKDQELTLAGTKVSGTIVAADKTPLKGAYISFVAADGEEAAPAPVSYKEDKGTYYVYVMPGTYTVIDQNGNVLKESVIVGDTDMSFDIETSLFCVDIITQEKADMYLFGENDFCINFGCGESGFSVYLPNGTYTLVNCNDALDSSENMLPLEDIAEDKKTTFTVKNANTKVEIK